MTEELTALRGRAEAAKTNPESIEWQQFWDRLTEDDVLALLDRLEQAEAAIERVRAVHRKETRLNNWTVCTHCAVGMLQDPVDWPCDTIAALGLTAEQEGKSSESNHDY